MADLGSRTNVNSAIDLLLDDLQPDEAIQPSDHNTLLKDILDTLANGLSTILRTSGQTNGENITINGGSQLLFNNVFNRCTKWFLCFHLFPKQFMFPKMCSKSRSVVSKLFFQNVFQLLKNCFRVVHAFQNPLRVFLFVSNCVFPCCFFSISFSK